MLRAIMYEQRRFAELSTLALLIAIATGCGDDTGSGGSGAAAEGGGGAGTGGGGAGLGGGGGTPYVACETSQVGDPCETAEEDCVYDPDGGNCGPEHHICGDDHKWQAYCEDPQDRCAGGCVL